MKKFKKWAHNLRCKMTYRCPRCNKKLDVELEQAMSPYDMDYLRFYCSYCDNMPDDWKEIYDLFQEALR